MIGCAGHAPLQVDGAASSELGRGRLLRLAGGRQAARADGGRLGGLPRIATNSLSALGSTELNINTTSMRRPWRTHGRTRPSITTGPRSTNSTTGHPHHSHHYHGRRDHSTTSDAPGIIRAAGPGARTIVRDPALASHWLAAEHYHGRRAGAIWPESWSTPVTQSGLPSSNLPTAGPWPRTLGCTHCPPRPGHRAEG